jgi:hypothetical protein
MMATPKAKALKARLTGGDRDKDESRFQRWRISMDEFSWGVAPG